MSIATYDRILKNNYKIAPIALSGISIKISVDRRLKGIDEDNNKQLERQLKEVDGVTHIFIHSYEVWVSVGECFNARTVLQEVVWQIDCYLNAPKEVRGELDITQHKLMLE